MGVAHDRTNGVRAVDKAIAGFFQQVEAGKIEIYNEFSKLLLARHLADDTNRRAAGRGSATKARTCDRTS